MTTVPTVGNKMTTRQGKVVDSPLRPSATNNPIEKDRAIETAFINDGIGGLSGNSWTKGTTTEDRERERKPYPNYCDDPDPIEPSASKKDHQTHVKVLRDYSSKLYEAYNKSSMRTENLWIEFITSFRPHTIRSWSKVQLHEWIDLLRNRGFTIKTTRSRSSYESVIDVLYWSDFGINDASKDIYIPDNPIAAKSNPIQYANNTKQGYGFSKLEHLKESEGHNDKGNEPSDGDSSSSDDSSIKSRNQDNMVDVDNRTNHDDDTKENNGEEKSLGVQGMFKAYIGQPKFGGRYEEDLEDVIEVFLTYSKMCNLTLTEKRKAIPIMLQGNALSLFNKEINITHSYDDAIGMMRLWYNSREKQMRLLREWQGMRLSTAMESEPKASEVEVYRAFVAKVMRIQKQLDKTYHGDQLLRDQLLMSIDVPSIQDSLKDKVPRSAQQLINRVANRLSDKPHSAGTPSAYFSSRDPNRRPDRSESCYTLGQNYGGEAKRYVKMYGKIRRGRGGRGTNMRDHSKRRNFPSWLRGVKGCMVCGKEDHIANQRHSEDEVREAIRKLKKKQYTALLTEEDMAYISELFKGFDKYEEGDEDVYYEEDEDDPESDIVYVASVDLEGIQLSLSKTAFTHGTEITADKSEMISAMYSFLLCNDEKVLFDGIRIDTAANRKSIMSMNQYNAYCKTFGLRPAIKPRTKGITGIGGRKAGRGTVMIQIPFPNLSIIINIDFLLIDSNVPTLLCMKDMIDNNLDISIQDRNIRYKNKVQKLVLENYFLVYRWSIDDMTYVLYTEGELRRIHKTFGHPSIDTTLKILKRASGDKLSKGTKAVIEGIVDGCKTCRLIASKPRRFKLTVGTNDLRFNHKVQIDTMFINGKPVLHMVDQATHFSAATFLKNQSSAEVWKAIQHLWNLVYLGPPDTIKVDQGSNYISRELRGELNANGIALEEAPIETPGAIGTVERYHAPLRLAFEKIRRDLGRDVADHECLRMAVFAVNSTIGPEGLCPILLVFGAIPRPARVGSSSSQIERAEAIDKATKEVEKEQARRRIAFGLRNPSGPKAKESSAILHELPAGSPILVYRHVRDRWEGPHTFISIDKETVVVQTPSGRKIFRSNCVKPWIKPEWTTTNNDRNTINNNDNDEREPNLAYMIKPRKVTFSDNNDDQLMNDITGHDTDNKIIKNDKGKFNAGISKMKESERAVEFKDSRRKELQGLISNGTFIPVDKSEVPEGARIFGSRFIDELKQADTGIRKKSRLVAQNYSDDEAAHLATKAPTIQRSTQRMIMSIAVSMKGMRAFTRDVTQAYVQSKSELERKVYVKAPQELVLEPGTILQVVKPLYGIPESGLHWYLTYLDYHINVLGMTRSKSDPCLLIKKEGGNLIGVVILQVDDSFCIGNKDFLIEEEQASKEFICKERRFITKEPTSFNGLMIGIDDEGALVISQTAKIEKLNEVNDEKDFISKRALAQYIGVCTRPDICANVQLIAPGTNPVSDDDYKTLNSTIKHLHNTKHIGLKYKTLTIEEVKLVLVTDASFANARNLRSQIGFVLMMVDNDGVANIIHYGSSRCKRVTRSIMAAEIHGLVYGFDQTYVVREALEEVLDRKISIEVYVDSKSVFDVVVKDGSTSEKRLQIDIFALRESYSRAELNKLGWIPGSKNIADPLTKVITRYKDNELMKVMKSNMVNMTDIGWADIEKGKSSN